MKINKTSSFLAIESYVPDSNIIISKHNGEGYAYIGRAYEASPLTGGGDELEVFISSVFKSAPDESVLQVNLIVSPDFDTPNVYKLNKHYGGEMVQELVRQTAEFSQKASTAAGALPELVMTNYKKLVISFAIPTKTLSLKTVENLTAAHDEFYEALKLSGFRDAKSLNPKELIGVYKQFADIYSPYQPAKSLDPAVDLKQQVFTSGEKINFEGEDSISFNGINCNVVVPKDYAEQAELGIANLLIGAPFNDGPPKQGGGGLRIRLPHIISSTVRLLNQEKEVTRLNRALRSRENVVRLPEMFVLGEENGKVIEDLLYMKRRLKDHDDKYTKASISYFLFSRAEEKNDLKRDLTTIKSLLDYQGFDASSASHNLGVRWAQALPLNYSRNIAEELENEVDMPSSAGSALLPVYGNWRGNANYKSTGSLFWSARGEPFFFDPYQTDGNMNGCIAAQPGGGKGVLANRMIVDSLANGNFVAVVDSGDSYRKLCEMVGGDYITFDLSNNKISLNPFSGLNAESFIDEKEFIVELMLKMACFSDKPTDYERTAMSEAVTAAWGDDDGRNADRKDISSVVDALKKASTNIGEFSSNHGLSEIEQASRNLSGKLNAFASDPKRSSFFSGPSNLKNKSKFVVVELSGLGSDTHLMDVVLFYALHQILSWVNKDDGKKIIFIDECWEILAKESAAGAIEGLYRKARKEGGAIWTITQSPLDFQKSSSGMAIGKFSNWHLVLSQKSDEVQKLLEMKYYAKFGDDAYFARTFKDVRTKKGKYSEILIINDSGYEKVRLYLNPFMLMVFNTEQEEREQVFALMDQGVGPIEAVETVAQNYSVSRRLWLERQIIHCIENEGYDRARLSYEINQILDYKELDMKA